MQLLTSLCHSNKRHFLDPFFFNFSSELHRQECHWEDAVAKLDNSILESSDKDVHPSKDSNKGSETEPTNISEVTENSGQQVPQFNCDQCISKDLLARK